MPCPCCQAATPPDGRFCAQCGAQLPAHGPAPNTTRRQLTVLFCDLVDSTGLARRVDPDDLLAALRHYHDTVRRVATRFGGYLGRIAGDGVDVYFGYPHANEDDASRALHAALALVAEVRRIEAVPGVPLAVRIGVATGIVAASVDHGVVAGTTPNLAARIQAVVPAGAIGVSPGTRRIAGAQFEFDDLGTHALKGFDTPVAIGMLRRARSLDSRSAWRGRDAELPIVGRAAELAALLGHWHHACAGSVHGAIVVGDPGLGKSRLVTALEQALPGPGEAVVRMQCSPFHVNSTLRPFARHLAAAAAFTSGDTPTTRLDKLERQLAGTGTGDVRDHALLAALLAIPTGDRYPALALAPPILLRYTKEALLRYFTGLASASPVLLVIEDMHWVDPTSLELVDMLLASDARAPILLVMTARPGFPVPWRDSPTFLRLPLRRLQDGEARVVAAQQSRRAALPAQWLATIVERADGVPLFIEEMTRMLLDSRAAGRDGDAAGKVPDTLLDLLTERLDRLPPEGKAMAQLASVIGREFDRALLASAAPDGGGAAWQAGLQAMLDSGLVLPRSGDDDCLMFRHALVEDTAYASLPPKRRAVLHGRVAAALLSRFSERVEHQPDLLARHLSRAGDGLQAAGWWQAAGARALARGAPREAAGHLRAGIAALHGMPPGQQRDTAELGLLAMLGPTTMVLLGPGSAQFGALQERSRNLSRNLPDQPRLFSINYGWCLFNWARARLACATELAGALLDTAAQHPGDAELAMAAHTMAGMVRFHVGDTAAARTHLARSTALHDPRRDAALYPVYLMDFGVFGRFYLALCTQLLGSADAARRIAADALALADRLHQPHTTGFAMLAGFNIAVIRGDTGEALPMAERCIAFSGGFGFPEFIAMARVARGWALAHGEGRWSEGLADLQAGIDGWARTGFENWQPWYIALEAEILIHLGQAALALRHVDQHLARIAVNGERQFESPLLAERAAALAALDGKPEAAAARFDAALALAREQGAAAWVERIGRRRGQAMPDGGGSVIAA